MTNNTKLGRWRFLLAALLAVVQLSAAHCAAGQQGTPANQNIYDQPFVNSNNDYSPGGPRLVVAHFIPNCDYGLTSYPQGAVGSPAQYMKDLQEARAAGVDVFAVNLFGNDAASDLAMTNLLTAADQIDAANNNASNSVGVRNIYVAFQPDFSSYPESASVLADAITRYSAHPSYYRFRGRPWFGTYTGDGVFAPITTSAGASVRYYIGGTLKLLAAQTPPIKPYVCPFWGIGSADDVNNKLVGLADAAWQFNGGLNNTALPSNPIGSTEALATLVHAGGLQWMASVSQQYFYNNARNTNETYGGETLDRQWQSIINVQKPYWTQIVTWNDIQEGTYETIADVNANDYDNSLQHGYSDNYPNTNKGYNGYYPRKDGLQAENLYWQQYWKMGAAPQINNETIIVTNRLQPAGLSIPNDPLGGFASYQTDDGGPAPDQFFITTICQQSEVLTVTNTTGGATTTTFSKTVGAGLVHTRVPFTPGVPTFTLSAGGRTLVTLTGNPIQAAATNGIYNWYYNSQVAHD